MNDGQTIFQVFNYVGTDPSGNPQMQAVAGSPSLNGAFQAVENLKLARYAICCLVVLKSTVNQLDSGLIIPKINPSTPTNGVA